MRRKLSHEKAITRELPEKEIQANSEMELAHCAADFWREKEKELKLSKNKNG
jgi:hypothetical protein